MTGKKNSEPNPLKEEFRSSYKERYAAGKALRDKCLRKAHAEWQPTRNRRDPIEMVLASERGRMPELLPLRHGRMVQSAFTFYRALSYPHRRSNTATT